MSLIRLSPRAKHRLQQIACSGSNGRSVRRAQALLWLDQSETAADVAQRLGVSRQAVYDWIESYQARQSQPVDQRLCDHPHSGRPDRKLQLVLKVVEPLLKLKRDPRRYGYRSVVWTVPILQQHLKRKTRKEVSQRTVRRALRKIRYRYKRPRHVLARRSPTWRQAKGGLNAA